METSAGKKSICGKHFEEDPRIGHPIFISTVLSDIQIANRIQDHLILKVMVKRILNKHGYPPDLQEEAVKTVLAQAELLCAEWV